MCFEPSYYLLVYKFPFLLLLLPISLPAQSPNIIFILVDDQRYDFLSFLDHPWIETPNIDRLAERSVYLDQAFVTTSLCSPSRASILTGQYAHIHGVVDNDTPIPAATTTFPMVLQQGGYHTGFIGKWHMGGNNDMPRSGFDHWVSFQGQGPYTDPTLNLDGERIPFEGYTPDILTDLAVTYIQEREAEERPYFLYLSHKSVHEDFTPAPRHAGRYADLQVPRPASFADTEANREGKPDWVVRQRRSWHGAERDFSIQEYGDFDRFFQLYSECMLGVDESVGRIAQTLEDLGQLEETIIVYYSDNGYLMGEHGLIDKRVMYEESIRVPAFVHWPASFPQAQRRDAMILTVDLGPTMLDMAGLEAPESMQGASFLPILNQQPVDWRTDFVYEYFLDPKAVQTPTIFGLRTQNHSYMTYHGVWDRYELYDLKADPQQRNNLLGSVNYGSDYGDFLKFARRQAPEHFPLVQQLDDRLTELVNSLGGSREPSWKQK
ncbi:MAG: sulfatase [Bacteroidota bacterium]